MRTLQIELDHSRWFGSFVFCIHGMAVVAMAISQVDLLLRLGVGLAIVCAGVVYWFDLQTGLFCRRPRCDDGQWQIDDGKGWQAATLLSRWWSGIGLQYCGSAVMAETRTKERRRLYSRIC